ncbi:MAG: 7TM-DISM domain-containing protein, partial [Ramlibacter sp.]
MRCTAAGALAGLRAFWLVGLLGLLAWAQPGAAQTTAPAAQPRTVMLADAEPVLEAHALGLGWVDAGGAATIEQVTQGPPGPRFAALRGDTIYSLGESSALWLHYRLLRGRNDRQGWLIEFPMPLLDSVTIYQQDGAGKWRAQASGDLMAVSRWAEAGRYPYFRLDLPA